MSGSEFATTVLVYGGTVGVYGAAGLAKSAYDDHAFKKAKVRQRALLFELEERPIPSPPPLSGTYQGASTESDNGDQDVKTTLNFHEDGTITGRGYDSEDGSYRVTDGRWAVLDGTSQATVAWTERYGSRGGFEVLVEGSAVLEPVTRINARFISSKGVRGKFELTR